MLGGVAFFLYTLTLRDVVRFQGGEDTHKVQVLISHARPSLKYYFLFFEIFMYLHCSICHMGCRLLVDAANWSGESLCRQTSLWCFMLKTHSTKSYLSDVHRCKQKNLSFIQISCIRAPSYRAYNHIKETQLDFPAALSTIRQGEIRIERTQTLIRVEKAPS